MGWMIRAIRGSRYSVSICYCFWKSWARCRRATKAQTQNEAMQMSMTVMLPSVFFCGFIFPRETMLRIFYATRTLLPLTYFIQLMRGIVLRGAGWREMWPHIAVLAGMGAILFSLCAMRFRQKPG